MTHTWHYPINLSHPLKLLEAPEPLFTGDKAAHTLTLTVTKGTEPLPLTGGVLRGYFIRGDGETLFLTGTAEGNTGTLTLPAGCYAAAGAFTLVVKWAGEAEIATLLALTGNVLDSSTDAVADPDRVIPSLSELLQQVAKIESATARADTAAAGAEAVTQSVTDKLNRGELTGKGLTILGYYDTVTALTQAVENPQAGDCYAIGTAAPYTLYVYDAVGQGWRNSGSLTGIPAGGNAGQVLTRLSDTEGDTGWTSPPVISVNGMTGAVTLPTSTLESHTLGSFSWWMESGVWTPLTKHDLTEAGLYLVIFRMELAAAVTGQVLAGIGLNGAYTAMQTVTTGISGAHTTVTGIFSIQSGDSVSCSIYGAAAGTYTLASAGVSLVKLA